MATKRKFKKSFDTPEIGWRVPEKKRSVVVVGGNEEPSDEEIGGGCVAIADYWEEKRVHTGAFGIGVAVTRMEVKIRWRCDCGREWEEWEDESKDAIDRGGMWVWSCGAECKLAKLAECKLKEREENPIKVNVRQIRQIQQERRQTQERRPAGRPAGKVVLYMYDDVREGAKAAAEEKKMSMSAWISEAIVEKLFGEKS